MDTNSMILTGGISGCVSVVLLGLYKIFHHFHAKSTCNGVTASLDVDLSSNYQAPSVVVV